MLKGYPVKLYELRSRCGNFYLASNIMVCNRPIATDTTITAHQTPSELISRTIHIPISCHEYHHKYLDKKRTSAIASIHSWTISSSMASRAVSCHFSSPAALQSGSCITRLTLLLGRGMGVLIFAIDAGLRKPCALIFGRALKVFFKACASM